MNNTNTNIIKVYGKNIDNFFQNIITNDIRNLNLNNPLYTALLSPQGKYLHDFFIVKQKNYFLLECNKDTVNNLIKEIKKYDIRDEVTVELERGLISKVVIKEKLDNNFSDIIKGKKIIEKDNYIFFLDPRSNNFLYRYWIKKGFDGFKKFNFSSEEEVEKKRILMKIPNSKKDLTYNKSFILNYNFENINALSFDKGCYIGQENTARQKYRGNLKYFLRTIKILKGQFPKINEDVFHNERKIGTIKSSSHNLFLCLIRNEYTKSDKIIKTDKSMIFEIL